MMRPGDGTRLPVSANCRLADGRDTVRFKLSLLPDADMLQKPTIIAVLVITVLTGIYFSMTPEDRDRWLSALGISDDAHMRVRLDRVQEQRQAAQAEEERRWREATEAAAPSDSRSRTLVDVCEEYHRLKAAGSDELLADDRARLARICGDY